MEETQWKPKKQYFFQLRREKSRKQNISKMQGMKNKNIRRGEGCWEDLLKWPAATLFSISHQRGKNGNRQQEHKKIEEKKLAKFKKRSEFFYLNKTIHPFKIDKSATIRLWPNHTLAIQACHGPKSGLFCICLFWFNSNQVEVCINLIKDKFKFTGCPSP